MEVEIKSEARSPYLNNAVAITVVALSMFMAVSKIKDDNIVQAMQAAKADALDTWNEYQSTRLKKHLSEHTVLVANLTSSDSGKTIAAKLAGDIAKYETESKDLAQKAKDFQTTYDAMNFRDDQFDLSDAGLAISLSLAAVAALTGLWWVLGVSWAFGAVGAMMAIAAFAQLKIHPDWLIGFLT